MNTGSKESDSCRLGPSGLGADYQGAQHPGDSITIALLHHNQSINIRGPEYQGTTAAVIE